MSIWCWVKSPVYEFCSFWWVAVNSVDKLQFLSLIFAVLLSITVGLHFIALRLQRAIKHQHTKILQFQKFKIAAAADILKIWKIAICLIWIDQFRENLAWWCASLLQTMSAYKILCVSIFNIVAYCHLESIKKHDISEIIWIFQQNFSLLMHNCPP